MHTQKSLNKTEGKLMFLAAALSGVAAGITRVKCPFILAGGLMSIITFLFPPEVLGFFISGGLYLTGRTIVLSQGELFFLNVVSFMLPLYCLLILLLLKKRVKALKVLPKCWEFWAVFGLGLLMLVRLPDSLMAEYGLWKMKYYLANNVVCFSGPVLAAAVWGKDGLYRFLKGVFLGGLALTAYFWLSGSYLDLPLNNHAVLNFNPIGLSRLIGLFVILVIFGGIVERPMLLRLGLAAAASAAMVILNARGPALALIIALLFGGCGLFGGKLRPLPLLVAPLFLVLALYIYLNYWFSPGLFSLDDTGRLQLYQAAVDMFVQNPLFGAGTGSYADLTPISGNTYPHNLFLEAAAELGLLGLGLSLLLVIAPLVRLLAKRGSMVKEALIAGPLLVFCFVNAMLSGDIPGNFILWLAVGVSVSLVIIAREDCQ